MQKESVFLWLAAAGLTPIALLYGFMPATTMPLLYGVEVDSVGLTHILRAVMCLYLAMAIFWKMGASNEALRLPALYSLVVFMGGLAVGRMASLVIDGMPEPLLVVYLLLEIGFAGIGYWLIAGLRRT